MRITQLDVFLRFQIFVLLANTTVCAAAQTQVRPVTVQVPKQWRQGVFSEERKLNVPSGYAIEVYAGIPHARFMAVAPDGDLLVAQPETPGKRSNIGTIYRIRGADGTKAQITTYAEKLRLPHGLAFHDVNGKTYLYVAESNGVVRFPYSPGPAHDEEQVVIGLPDSSSPELHGAYGHELKNITFGPGNKLYVDLGSTCNICLSDTQSNPRRAAIYVYDENGKNGRLFAQGIRNGEGVKFFPDSNDLWVTFNARDNMPDPRGKVRTEYVDDHPPDTLTHARDGGNYGWPFCQPDSDTTTRNLPFVRDMNMNKNGRVDCSKMDRHDLALGPHVAALGLEFVPGSLVGSQAKTVALISMRGSWNRSRKSGYKIVYVPFGADAKPSVDKPVDLVTGWLNDATQEAWGRPVDAVAGKGGSIFISDDTSGTVYRLYRQH